MKPPYRIPTMVEIAAIPYTGLTVASTFSGCGGSSLGYRLAGFRVVWANEFVPAAQDTYRANFPATPLDIRDIRTIQPAEILSATGLRSGALDVLDGSPPCASFSTAGVRSAHWGAVKAYSDTTQRTDDLFDEFVRLLREIQPRVFIAENVSGLVKGVAKGYFLRILAALSACGYRVESRVLDAQWLGVPQSRQRLIFVGVRNDLDRVPAYPTPLPYRYSVRDALPWIINIGHGASYGKGEFRSTARGPATTIGAGPSSGNGRFPPSQVDAIGTNRGTRTLAAPSPTVLTHGREHTTSELTLASGLTRRRLTIDELKRICAFPADFTLTGTYAQQWERLGRAVPPPMMAAIASTIRDRIFGGAATERASA